MGKMGPWMNNTYSTPRPLHNNNNNKTNNNSKANKNMIAQNIKEKWEGKEGGIGSFHKALMKNWCIRNSQSYRWQKFGRETFVCCWLPSQLLESSLSASSICC
jgi:restriction endonuclease S subunit